MKNKADYSKYKCPYSHIDKECGHELHGPEGYEDTYGVWCACGFRGPVFCLDPAELNLHHKPNAEHQARCQKTYTSLLGTRERSCVGCAHVCKHLNRTMTDYLEMGPVYSYSCGKHIGRLAYNECSDFDAPNAPGEGRGI